MSSSFRRKIPKRDRLSRRDDDDILFGQSDDIRATTESAELPTSGQRQRANLESLGTPGRPKPIFTNTDTSDLTPEKGDKIKGKKRSYKSQARITPDSDDVESNGDDDDDERPAKKRRIDEGKKSKGGKRKSKGTTTFDKIGETNEEAYIKALPDLIEDRDAREVELRSNEKYKSKLVKHGVFVVGLPATCESAGKVAGYLNLHNKNELGAIWTEIAPLDKRFFKHHKANFDMEQNAIMDPDTFFTAIDDKEIEVPDLESDGEPDAAKYPTSADGDRTRQWLFTLRFIYKCKRKIEAMNDIPIVFTGPPEGAVGGKSYFKGTQFEITGEDLYRMVVFTGFLVAKNRQSQKGTKVQSGQPELPVFVIGNPKPRVDAARRNAAAGATTFKTLMQSGGLLRLGAPEMILKSIENGVSDEDAAHNVDKTVSTKTFLSDRVPLVSDEERNGIIRSMAAQAEIMFEDKEYQDKTFFGRTATDPILTDAVAEAESDKPDRAQVIDEALNDFLALQASLNRNSSAPPSFAEAEQALRLVVTPDLPEKDNSTEDFFSIVYEGGVHLTTWQPQGIHWLVRMMRSPLGAGVIGDDGGLGKTLQLLCAVVEMSRLKEIERQKWEDRFAEIVAAARAYCLENYLNVEMKSEEELIKAAGLTLKLEELGAKPTHKPVLVMVPPPALNSWLKTFREFFTTDTGSYHIEYRTLCNLGQKRAKARDKAKAIKGHYTDGLLKFKKRLNPDKPQTSRTVVLTTYQSWHRKVLKTATLERSIPEPPPAPKPKNRRSKDDDEADDEEEDDEEEEADEEEDSDDDDAPKYGLKGKTKERKDTQKDRYRRATVLRDGVEDMFSIRIADEAHRLKDPDSKQAIAFNKLKDCKTALATATAYKNKIEDFYGVLIPLYSEVKKRFPVPDPNVLSASSYQEFRKVFKEKYGSSFVNMSEAEQLKMARGLNPEKFLELCKSESDKEGSVMAGVNILPLPSSLVILRRVKGDKVDLGFKTVVLGAEIGKYTIIGVESRQGAAERQYYRGILETIKSLPTDGIDEDLTGDDQQTTSAILKRRRLILASCYPYLDHFVQRKVDSKATKIHQKSDKGWDSYSFLHNYTKQDIHSCTPTGRLEMAQYICGASVKMATLSLLLERHVIQEGNKAMLWCNEPINLFLVSTLLDIYQIKFVSIHAGIKNDARIKAERDFERDASVQVCVLSTRSASESMNMQRACHIQISIDVISTTQKIQCVCRCHRIGQTHDVIMYCLTTDETYDQVLQALYSSRFRVAVAAQTTIDEDHVNRIVSNLPEALRLEYQTLAASDPKAQSIGDIAMRPLRGPYADATMRKLLGLRTDRHLTWNDPWDPCKKNELPPEIIFRIGYGGAVANECGEQLRLRGIPKDEKEDSIPPMEKEEDKRFKQVAVGTAFSLPQMAMKSAPQLDQATGAEYILNAAKEICRGEAFVMNNYTVIDFLRSAARWFKEPSSYFIRAVKIAEREQEQLENDLMMDDDEDSNEDDDGNKDLLRFNAIAGGSLGRKSRRDGPVTRPTGLFSRKTGAFLDSLPHRPSEERIDKEVMEDTDSNGNEKDSTSPHSRTSSLPGGRQRDSKTPTGFDDDVFEPMVTDATALTEEDAIVDAAVEDEAIADLEGETSAPAPAGPGADTAGGSPDGDATNDASFEEELDDVRQNLETLNNVGEMKKFAVHYGMTVPSGKARAPVQKAILDQTRAALVRGEEVDYDFGGYNKKKVKGRSSG